MGKKIPIEMSPGGDLKMFKTSQWNHLPAAAGST